MRAARWTLRQLDAVERRIRGGSDWFRQRDLTIEGWGIRESENLVVIDAIVPAPDPSLEARIIDHFDAEGMLRVAIEVIPTVDFSDAGALVVKVRDTNGRDTDGVHCWLQSDERVTAGEADVMVLDGSCRWEVVKPVAVRVTIWRHFQAGFLGEIVGAVRPGATTSLEVTVALP